MPTVEEKIQEALDTNATKLDLSDMELTTLPESIGNLTNNEIANKINKMTDEKKANFTCNDLFEVFTNPSGCDSTPSQQGGMKGKKKTRKGKHAKRGKKITRKGKKKTRKGKGKSQ